MKKSIIVHLNNRHYLCLHRKNKEKAKRHTSHILMTEVEIRFIFANYDGVNVVVKTTLDTLLKDVKLKLLSQWPQDLPACDDTDRLRMFCMGKKLPEDSISLGTSFPVYDYPTPVNVAIRPAHIIMDNGKAVDTLKADPLNESADRRCCTIS